MSVYYLVFLTLAVSQLLLLGLYILLHHRHSALGVLSGCLALTLVAGLLGEALNVLVSADNPTLLIYMTMALNRIGNVSMLLTWLLALKLFDDNFDLRRVHLGVWLLISTALIARSIGSYYANYEVDIGFVGGVLTWGYSQTVLLGFSLASIYVAIKGYRSDLVIERRHERVIFVICAAILLLLMAGNRGIWVITALTGGTLFSATPIPAVVYSIYAYFVSLALFLWKFRVIDLSDKKIRTRAEVDPLSMEKLEQEKELSNRVKQAMEQEKLYHEPSLTVAALATHVGSQEYLVRRAINKHMGYRNFSDFLNHYRISETSLLLTSSDEPISNIGLDVGYTSLSSFYKAFKTRYAMTPRQYRAQHAAKG